MRLLILYGVNCTRKIWDSFRPFLIDHEVDYVEYPHEVTLKAEKVEELTKWVYENYHCNSYQAVIGHSLGGIIALQLAAKYKMKFENIIYLDTNLKPAKEFYRNLMTPEHMNQFGDEIVQMFNTERAYYTCELLESIQNDEFDYTDVLKEIPQKVYGIYGDRGIPEYRNRIYDLNLSDETLKKLELKFITNACHMIMLENPKQLYQSLETIWNHD